METDLNLEKRIAEWRACLLNYKAIAAPDSAELEDHLRNQIAILGEAGLDDEEAFIIAVRRMGEADSISREFALEYSERLWKQFTPPVKTIENRWGSNHEPTVVILLAILAAVAVKIPALFGMQLNGSDAEMPFWVHNFSFFTLPFLTSYFVWKRGLEIKPILALAVTFSIAALAVNLMPFTEPHHTEGLTSIHLPLMLWFAVGFAYAGGNWKNHDRRMNYVRFTGEWFIYISLIGSGGGVLVGAAFFIFYAIGLNAEQTVASWVLPCGVVGAVVISAWLVEAKQSIIENMAPVLARIFTPLFALLLLSFLVIMLATGRGINVERDVLIGFDLLLVLILGLLLYSISARDNQAPANLFDWLQLVLVISALLVDILALLAIVGRISEFGFSPNKVAALGLNIILVVNLGWSAVLLVRFLTQRSTFVPLAHWQTAYIPVYAFWTGIVALLFPAIFNYR